MNPHEFPFFAHFHYKGKWYHGRCGGALITSRHVLSCQHCFNNEAMNCFECVEVVFGKTLPNDEGVAKKKVHRIVFHPSLDFSILVLESEVPLSQYVKTIGLPEINSDFSGQNATLAGTGRRVPGLPTAVSDPGTLLMMKVTLKVGSEPGEKCPSERHVCATSLRGKPGKPGWGSGCDGDSGAPLFICKGGHP